MFAYDDDNYDYTYNEEYVYTIPEAPSEPPTYLLSSDSENEPPSFGDDSSSCCSSVCDDEDYFEKYKRLGQTKYLPMEREDNETDLIIPLETDDADFGAIQADKDGQMVCTICSTVFRNKLRYGIHQRRHFARDHFKCPICSRGFSKLSQCQTHELREHNMNTDRSPHSGSSPEKRGYSFRTRNARKTHHFNENLEFEEADMSIIVPSTTLYPYRGPDVVGPYKAYEVEVKYGRPERKSHSRLQAKYVLETQKRCRRNLELKMMKYEKLAKKNAEKALLIANRRAEIAERITSINGEVRVAEIGDLLDEAPISPDNIRTAQTARARSLHPAGRKLIFSPTENSGPKCYFCSLCGFTSNDKLGIHDHKDQVHPEVPVSELLQFLIIDKSLKEKKEKPKTVEADETVKRRRGRPKGSFKAHSARAIKLSKIEKIKEAKLFRYRKHVPRVWEKPADTLKLEEFIFALNLVRKTDVLLGPRKKQSVISSSLLRNGRRGTSPAPTMQKSVQIKMKRLVTKNKKVFLCDHCDYCAPSKSEVRRHRRNEHLKHLRQDTLSDPKRNKANAISGKKHKHRKKNGIMPSTVALSTDAIPLHDGPAGNSRLNHSGVKRYSCLSCDFIGFSRTEMEDHELRLHDRTLQLQVCEIPQDVIAKLLQRKQNGTLTSISTAMSSPSSSASSSRSSSPPRKKSKVDVS